MTPALLAIIAQLIPEIPLLISSIVNLRKKYPALSADQIQTIIASVTSQADTAFDDVLAKIEADKAKV